ncbi:hypothetical protein [[Arthrobacter] sp. ATCC 21022]|uniref:Uncharacterized protein n=3 Tax=Marthavirus martha TaxID=1980950 RepID=A0A0U4IG42_9CAUD|nr:hypothetical protein FDH49_gp65 [Arthrobacter phage Martha]ALY09718.1 hypothetical protein MARTHA_65 [Arthrobacter phage Martha]ALY10523.1 hypothetical protein TAEYOUNG_66 [Arthrobacter phage TaeYoung]KUR66400.1 hypothetical protein JM67_00060 [Arthrobacter sp. ATCC 21022]QED11804.1 hypothetical protein SEA_BOSSLADY_66 [Arthrobacter phage BossLady]
MTQLLEYFIGGKLDGQTRDFDKSLPPQIAYVDQPSGQIDVYVRQPIFDDHEKRHWVAVESPAEMLALREFTQGVTAGQKHFTVAELRAAVAALDAMGFPDDAPVRAQITWTGHLKHLSTSRDDKQETE